MYHYLLRTVCGLLTVLYVLSLLTACGQKGDLYLPDEQQSYLPALPPSA